jgi:nicotinate-nucleotide--dimethylbenzimidazole phosphoribosyltransferase
VRVTAEDPATLAAMVGAPQKTDGPVDVARRGRLATLVDWVAAVREAAVPAVPAAPVPFTRPVLVSAGPEPAPGLDARRLEPGDDAAAAFEAGRALADTEVDSGADLLMVAGIGDPARATALVAAFTWTEPAKAAARGVDDSAWVRTTGIVRDALRDLRGRRDDPMAVLTVAGDATVAGLAGVCFQAAVRRTPVLLDGLGAVAAALGAARLAPGAVDWWLAADLGAAGPQRKAIEELSLDPVLALDLRLDDGTGAALALAVLQTLLGYGADSAS